MRGSRVKLLRRKSPDLLNPRRRYGGNKGLEPRAVQNAERLEALKAERRANEIKFQEIRRKKREGKR